MASKTITTDPFDFVAIGGTGDLVQRKLMPALYARHLAGQIIDRTRIIGVARAEHTTDSYRNLVRSALCHHLKNTCSSQIDAFLGRVEYAQVTTEPNGFEVLQPMLASNQDYIRVFYLAVAPDIFGTICRQIKTAGLVTANSRVVVEKPVGTDLHSSKVINDEIGAIFSEESVYRIDHYLGKETVQNLMALRFANALFEPLWNSAHIDHIQITVAETLGIGDRGSYYDSVGALRDMVQNHILQLLCLVAMEPPSYFDANNVRDEKLKVIKALKPIVGVNAEYATVRGQYISSNIAGFTTLGYRSEIGDHSSDTETFVALKAEICNWRWAGVPFYLRTGKCMPKRISEIVITFKSVPHQLFDSSSGAIESNRLIIRLQPDEGVKMQLMIKDPGPGGMRLRPVYLDMSFAAVFGVSQPEAYERLVMDVVRGNQTLFMRRDEVEAAWTWIDPIIKAWHSRNVNVKPYPAGSWGPADAGVMINRDQRVWHEE